MAKANLKKDKWFLKQVKLGRLRVKSNGKIINCNTGKTIGSTQGGYIRVGLQSHKTGKIHIILAHRLVWLAFNGLIADPSVQINHIDGNKTNNKLSNLELTNNSENVRHAYTMGLNKVSDYARYQSSKRTCGENNINSKFTNKQVKSLRKKYKNSKITILEIANKYKTTCRTVKSMLSGVTYSHIPGYCDLTNKVGRPKQISKQKVEEMVAMRYAGHTVAEVAEFFDIHPTTVSLNTSHLV